MVRGHRLLRSSIYVLAFFTTVSNGYKDHPRVFNRLSRDQE
jgi:hypothetical protein